VQRDATATLRFRRLLAISIMSALTLGAVLLARADTWVTVNPDGSVTRTEAAAQVAPSATTAASLKADYDKHYRDRSCDVYPNGYAAVNSVPNGYNGLEQPVYSGALTSPPSVAGATPPNTTFFAGTFYPVPSYSYSYPTPGYSYPVGPIYPRVPPPVVTTLPSTAYGYGYGAPYCPPATYPYPVYSYPNYVGTGIYYSGPAGGGGTIYSNSTTSRSGFGVSVGSGGWNVNLGNRHHSHQSTTTVTTSSHR
jgi:hypothetical protein